MSEKAGPAKIRGVLQSLPVFLRKSFWIIIERRVRKYQFYRSLHAKDKTSFKLYIWHGTSLTLKNEF